MSEEFLKNSVFDIFSQTQENLQEAEERAKKEAGAPRVERYRIGEDGTFSLRILPLAPKLDEDGNPMPMERKGFEFPMHQLFLAIKLPSKGDKKPKTINVPVIRTTDKEVGFSADLIDTYVQIAQEIYSDDDALMAKIKEGSYNGGLRWSYVRMAYVLDLDHKRKGPMLWTLSNAQYKSLNEERIRVWKKLAQKKGGPIPCVVSSIYDAFPVEVVRGNNNGRIDYKFSVDTISGTDELTEEELQKLLDTPRIDEYAYRFTRYQLEAELEFLKQYDEMRGIEVCKEPDFIEAYEKISGELPSDDKSHFDISSASKDSDNEKTDEVTIDSLWNELDALADAGVDEKSAESQELREKIRQFVQTLDLDVHLSRSKSNQQMLTEIDEALSEREKTVKATPTVEKESAPQVDEDGVIEERPKRRKRPSDDDIDATDKKAEEPKSDDEAEEEAPVKTRRRRLR